MLAARRDNLRDSRCVRHIQVCAHLATPAVGATFTADRPTACRSDSDPSLHDFVGHHLEKQRIVIHRGRPRHRQADVAAHVSGLDVQVVQHST